MVICSNTVWVHTCNRFQLLVLGCLRSGSVCKLQCCLQVKLKDHRHPQSPAHFSHGGGLRSKLHMQGFSGEASEDFRGSTMHYGSGKVQYKRSHVANMLESMPAPRGRQGQLPALRNDTVQVAECQTAQAIACNPAHGLCMLHVSRFLHIVFKAIRLPDLDLLLLCWLA